DLSSRLGLGPARIGLVLGTAAVATTILNPIYGRLADRWGARPLTLLGLVLAAFVLPAVPHAWSFPSAVALWVIEAAMAALAITPSLAYMGEATSTSGIGSFGVAYGLYNVAWGVGLVGGPAVGGFLYERVGFSALALGWAPIVVGVPLALARARRAPAPDAV